MWNYSLGETGTTKRVDKLASQLGRAVFNWKSATPLNSLTRQRSVCGNEILTDELRCKQQHRRRSKSSQRRRQE
jgi:hypothetical protein